MSKAFTRESDDQPEPPLVARPAAPPPGLKAHLTPDGARRLRAELDRLLAEERPRLAGATDPDARRELAAVDQRVGYLQQRLPTALVVPPPPPPWDEVRFGAVVTVRDAAGETEDYRLVGVDEADLDRNWISFQSPLAKALLHARLGQRVRFRRPGGDTELEITGITYEPV